MTVDRMGVIIVLYYKIIQKRTGGELIKKKGKVAIAKLAVSMLFAVTLAFAATATFND